MTLSSRDSWDKNNLSNWGTDGADCISEKLETTTATAAIDDLGRNMGDFWQGISEGV